MRAGDEEKGHQPLFLKKKKKRKNRKMKFLRHSFLFLRIPASLSPNKSHTVIQHRKKLIDNMHSFSLYVRFKTI